MTQPFTNFFALFWLSIFCWSTSSTRYVSNQTSSYKSLQTFSHPATRLSLFFMCRVQEEKIFTRNFGILFITFGSLFIVVGMLIYVFSFKPAMNNFNAYSASTCVTFNMTTTSYFSGIGDIQMIDGSCPLWSSVQLFDCSDSRYVWQAANCMNENTQKFSQPWTCYFRSEAKCKDVPLFDLSNPKGDFDLSISFFCFGGILFCIGVAMILLSISWPCKRPYVNSVPLESIR